MKRLFAGATGMAVAIAFSLVASAQTADQTPQPQTPTSSQPAAQQPGHPEQMEVTIVGCVQSESDYRRAHDLGRAGAAGTGMGAGNEFVLVNASTSTGSSSSTPSASSTPGTTGTAGGSAATGDAYELTGKNEGQVGQYVGKRVEIVGKLKAAEVGATGATGGPTAGTPPRGVDVASKDLKLRELEVTSVRETTGSCPSASR